MTGRQSLPRRIKSLLSRVWPSDVFSTARLLSPDLAAQTHSLPPNKSSQQDLKASLVTLEQSITYRCEPGCIDCCRRFGYIPVNSEEVEWLRGQGASVWFEAGEWRFNIRGGCQFIKSNGCAIYDQALRPDMCKRIVCLYMVSKLNIPKSQIIFSEPFKDPATTGHS